MFPASAMIFLASRSSAPVCVMAEQQRDADERGKHGGAEAADQIFIGQAEDTHHDNAERDCHNTDVDLAEESQQDHDDEQHQRDNVKCSFHK